MLPLELVFLRNLFQLLNSSELNCIYSQQETSPFPFGLFMYICGRIHISEAHINSFATVYIQTTASRVFSVCCLFGCCFFFLLYGSSKIQFYIIKTLASDIAINTKSIHRTKKAKKKKNILKCRLSSTTNNCNNQINKQ